MAWNNSSKAIDVLNFGVWYRGHKNIRVCSEYDMRFRLSLTTGTTSFYKFFCPYDCEINQIRLFINTIGGGLLKLAIYEADSGFKLKETNLQPGATVDDFQVMDFASNVQLK